VKILVTGATGFLGTALCRRLGAQNYEIRALGSRDADLRVRGCLDQFKGPWDQIYHLAAWTQAGDFCLRNPGEQWIRNQQINTNVLEWWQSHQPQAKLISIGTSCAYSPDSLLSEEYYLTGVPIESLFTYAHTKRMLLVGQLALARQFGANWLTVVPSTLYGPGYHTDGRQMHFVFDLIRKILRGKHLGERVELWGNGYQKRELVYVEDFVSALVDLSKRVSNEVVNIGAGQDFTIREFAEMISFQVGFNHNQISYDESKYTGARAKRLETAKLRSLLPNWRQTPLHHGLKATVEWMQSEKNIWQSPPV